MGGDVTSAVIVNSSVFQAHEGTVVLRTDQAHEGGKANVRVSRHTKPLGKADSMDPYRAPAVRARLIERGNGVEGSLYGLACELITEHKHADALIGSPIGADRLLHARNGVGLAEGRPGLGTPADLGALLHGIREPLALGVLKHVAP